MLGFFGAVVRYVGSAVLSGVRVVLVIVVVVGLVAGGVAVASGRLNAAPDPARDDLPAAVTPRPFAVPTPFSLGEVPPVPRGAPPLPKLGQVRPGIVTPASLPPGFTLP